MLTLFSLGSGKLRLSIDWFRRFVKLLIFVPLYNVHFPISYYSVCLVDRFTNTYTISTYHHFSCEFDLPSWSHTPYNIMWYTIIVNLWQVIAFLWSTQVSSIKKSDGQDMTEILLKVALNAHELKPRLIIDKEQYMYQTHHRQGTRLVVESEL